MNRQNTCFFIALLAVASPARAETYEVAPGDDLEAAFAALEPGDELVLAGGTYELVGRTDLSAAGTAAAPILIRAKDGERPHLHYQGGDQNIIEIDDAAYLTLRGLEFTGGSAGIRIVSASYLTIEGCEIHDTGDVALRANDGGPYDHLHIVGNEIHHTNGYGEGMYLGCNNDACRISNSVIERNHVHHTNQDTVDQGDGIELKRGSFGNVIRDNVIHDTTYPCITTYGTAGNGPPNIIEGNVLWGCGDHGIQAAADTTIRNNLLFGASADGIAMQPHQGASPAALVVVHNTIIQAHNDAISLTGVTGSVTIANNALYAEEGYAIAIKGGGLGGVRVAGNVGEGGIAGLTGGFVSSSLAADLISASYTRGPMNAFPAAGGSLIGAADAAYAVADDFNYTRRAGTLDVGAYVFAAGGNPGWLVSEDFKQLPEAPEDVDPDDDGSDDGDTPTAVDEPENSGAPPTQDDKSGVDTSRRASTDVGAALHGCRTVAGSDVGALALVLALSVFSRRRARSHGLLVVLLTVAALCGACQPVAPEPVTESGTPRDDRDSTPNTPGGGDEDDDVTQETDTDVPADEEPLPSSGGCYRDDEVPMTTGPHGFAMPDVADEEAAYLRFGWTFAASARPHMTAEADFWIADPDIHGDMEGDDLWTHVMQSLRTGEPGYLDRARGWLRYFRDDYVQCVGGQYDSFCFDRDEYGADHLWGWGLISWALAEDDDEALAAAIELGAQVEALWSPATPHGCIPTSGCLHYGSRLIGRHLLFMTRLAEVTADPRWVALRDRMIAMLLASPQWNEAEGMYFYGEYGTDTVAGTGAYDAGLRLTSTFMIGVLGEGMDHAYRATGNPELRRRMVKTAAWVKKYGLDPEYDYASSSIGVKDGVGYQGYNTGGAVTYWDPVYTTALVNVLVRGYLYTCDEDYFEAAKHAYIRANGGLHREPVERSVPDGVIHHFVDSSFSSSSGNLYFEYNKGELIYTYLLFDPLRHP